MSRTQTHGLSALTRTLVVVVVVAGSQCRYRDGLERGTRVSNAVPVVTPPTQSSPGASTAALLPSVGKELATAAASSPVEVRRLVDEPRVLDIGEAHRVMYFRPRRAESSQPIMIMLHGMCALPEYECPVFRAGVLPWAWLVCPPGPTPCKGGGAMWSGSDKRLGEVVGKTLVALHARHPEADFSRRALIGYSLGATAALRMASVKAAGYQALLILNAGFSVNPSALTKAGVARVALVAGDRDATKNALRRSVQGLTSAGLKAQFFILSGTGHYFDDTTEQRLIEPISWLGAGL